MRRKKLSREKYGKRVVCVSVRFYTMAVMVMFHTIWKRKMGALFIGCLCCATRGVGRWVSMSLTRCCCKQVITAVTHSSPSILLSCTILKSKGREGGQEEEHDHHLREAVGDILSCAAKIHLLDGLIKDELQNFGWPFIYSP